MKKVIILSWLLLCIVLAPFSPLTKGIVADAKGVASDVEGGQMLHVSEDAKRLFKKNGFVVVPTRAYKDMNEAYMAFRKDNLPIFVTTDSILYTTHFLFDYLLKTIEVDQLMGDLRQLTTSMLKGFIEDYIVTNDEEVKKAISANIAFFSVAARLLQEKEAIPRYVKDVVEAELKLIKKHEGFKKSSVLGYLEDYSQYVPRGHYTRSEEFESYFKAMMWYGRMDFYLNPSESLGITEELTKQALLIVKALNTLSIEGKPALVVWERIYEPTTFFVGKTDDLTIYDYKKIAFNVYGKIPGVEDLKVSIKGKDQIVQGPVFSYYEFKQPLSDRLTDEQWQKMLKEGKEPSLPRWTREFIGK